MSKNKKLNPQSLEGVINQVGDDSIKPSPEFKTLVNECADAVATDMGYDNAAQLYNEVKPNVIKEVEKSKDPKDTLRFEKNVKIAGDFLNALTMLVLKQEVVNLDNFNYMNNATDKFYNGELDEGNAKQLIRNLETGIAAWAPAQFVPDQVTNGALEQHTFKMYNQDGTLYANAYQFKKMITIQRAVYLPYFISGELATFIARLTAQLQRVYNMFIFDKVMTLICNKANYKKVITPKADSTDMFRCFVNDIFPAIADMETATIGYYISVPEGSNAISASTKDDRIMLMSKANKARYSSGILSQLFNNQFASLDNIVSYENIINPGNKIVIGDVNNIITVDDTKPYIDDNTIIVLTKEAFKQLRQINVSLTQEWAHNMTIEHVYHAWGTMDMVKWGMGFTYTNVNLSKQPAGN